jgi:hypothetical protein
VTTRTIDALIVAAAGLLMWAIVAAIDPTRRALRRRRARAAVRARRAAER